jgi:ribose transport system substrate-binding protein
MTARKSIVAGTIAVGLLVSCTPGSQSGPTTNGAGVTADPADGATVELALVLGTSGSPFYETLACGAQAKAEELGVDLEVAAADEFAAAPQIAVLNGVIASDPDAAIVVPTDTRALIEPLRQASDAGIEVLTADQTIADDSFVSAEIVSDNFEGGAMAADELAELIGGEGKVLVITQPPGSAAQDARVEGFEARLAEEYPDIEYLGPQYQSNEPARAAQIVTSTLSAHPDLAGIFATNDQGSIGTVTGLQQADAADGQVKLVAYDAATAQVNALRNGDIQALIAQAPYQEGQVAVETAVAVLEGEEVEQEIFTELVVLRPGDDATIDEFEYSPAC